MAKCRTGADVTRNGAQMFDTPRLITIDIGMRSTVTPVMTSTTIVDTAAVTTGKPNLHTRYIHLQIANGVIKIMLILHPTPSLGCGRLPRSLRVEVNTKNGLRKQLDRTRRDADMIETTVRNLENVGTEKSLEKTNFYLEKLVMTGWMRRYMIQQKIGPGSRLLHGSLVHRGQIRDIDPRCKPLVIPIKRTGRTITLKK